MPVFGMCVGIYKSLTIFIYWRAHGRFYRLKFMVILEISRKLTHINKLKPWIQKTGIMVDNYEENHCRFDTEEKFDTHMTSVVNSHQGEIAGGLC